MANLQSRTASQRPDLIQIFGHSYTAGAVGTAEQTGRFDALLSSALGTDYTNRRNHSLSGAILSIEGRGAGGWGRIFQELKPSRGGPYTASGGMKLFCFGINDLGFIGSSVMVQMTAAYVQALRACISRARAATVRNTDHASITYGAGFTSSATTTFTGPNFRQCTITGGTATLTITLPSDYQGEPVGICMLGMPGVVGGTITWSGTAGVTGTTSTSNIMPSATLSRCPVLKRVTGLTAANAGQTIIGTVTALDAGGGMWFDSYWLESIAPPVVLVCDINRLTAAGYAGYASWTGTEAQKDNDVNVANQAVAVMESEFDGAVVIVPLDEIVGKAADKTFDGIHLNEVGAALAVDAMLLALDQVAPPSQARGQTATLNVPSSRLGAVIVPRLSANWYSADFRQYGTNYTAVSGDLWAIPFQINGATDRYINFCVEAIASVTGTSVRWGVYNDYQFGGYPKYLEFEATSAGAFVITTGAGIKVSTGFTWIPDPGLYWLAIKFGPVGVTHTFRTLAGPCPNMPSAGLTGLPLSATTYPMGWFLAGQGTTAFPAVFPTTAAIADNAPYLGIKLN
jgi:lysophospholipase L1-like esterase